LHRIARGHPGASSGERAAWEILQNLRKGTAVNFAGCFVRLDGAGKRAVLQLMFDLSMGVTGLTELG
jgi:acetyl-CoA acetyltransferase